MLNYFHNVSSSGSEGQHLPGLFLCIEYSYSYSGLNYINGMQNLYIINVFSCIRLIVYMLELHNYITKQEHRGAPYKHITG